MTNTKPTLQERKAQAAYALECIGAQVLEAAFETSMCATYMAIKLIALPLNVAEAFANPREWAPPWR